MKVAIFKYTYILYTTSVTNFEYGDHINDDEMFEAVQ